MKPASLGFTIPGMIEEYGVPKQTASLVPFFALVGTVVGSDPLGHHRRHLRAKGLDPSFGRDVRRDLDLRSDAVAHLEHRHVLHDGGGRGRHVAGDLCAACGDDAQQASRLEPGPRRRAWSVGGYFAASGLSALLQPEFGWRILWLLNLPTGLSLVLLGALIPESAKFLLARGRREEAQRVMERFGSQARSTRPAEAIALSKGPTVALTGRAFFGKLFALSLAAICYGLINFGLLLWLPARPRLQGLQRGADQPLARRVRADRLPDDLRRRLRLQPHRARNGRSSDRSP